MASAIKTVGDLQPVVEGIGAELYGLIIKVMESVGCPSWPPAWGNRERTPLAFRSRCSASTLAVNVSRIYAEFKGILQWWRREKLWRIVGSSEYITRVLQSSKVFGKCWTISAGATTTDLSCPLIILQAWRRHPMYGGRLDHQPGSRIPLCHFSVMRSRVSVSHTAWQMLAWAMLVN